MSALRSSPLWKRLPFLLVVAVGLLIWKTGYMPKDRTLVWDLPDDPSIRGVEVQLYDGHELLKREQFFFPSGPSGKLEEHVRLGRGDYQVRFVVTRDGQPLRSSQQPLQLRSEEVVERPVHP